MASSSSSVPIPYDGLMGSLQEFARNHAGEFIHVTLASGQQIGGILEGDFIIPGDGGDRIVFPQTGVTYKTVMTSIDGQNITGQMDKLGYAKDADAERAFLHQLTARIGDGQEKLKARLKEVEHERREESRRAQSERQELLKRTTTAERERAEMGNMLGQAQSERAELLSRVQGLEDRINRSGSMQSNSPGPADPTLTNILLQMQMMMQNMSQNMGGQAPTMGQQGGNDGALQELTAMLNPVVSSHGPGHCRTLTSAVTGVLESNNFVPYRWAAGRKDESKSFADRIRQGVIEMAALLNGNPNFEDWAKAKSITLSTSDWALWQRGDKQDALEMAVSIRLRDRELQALLAVARCSGVDPTRLDEHASGKLPVAGEPLFGGHKSHNAPQDNSRGRGRGGRGGYRQEQPSRGRGN